MKKILVLTNLYPLPWESNRATFNRQQFEHLSKFYELSYLVPVAWPTWLRKMCLAKKAVNSFEHGSVRFCWYFYIPKILRSLSGVMMFFSLMFNSLLWIRKKNPDLIIGCWAFPDGFAAYCIAKLLRKKFILKVHGSDINVSANSKMVGFQIRFISMHTDSILSVSKALKIKLIKLGVPESKVDVIYNGVDQQLFNCSDCNEDLPQRKLLYIGNLKREKGIFELLHAFGEILDIFPDVKLIYIGQGPMLNQLVDSVVEQKIQSSVEIIGQLDHKYVPAYIKAAQVVVLPSYSEGVPNVLLESMACGKPVVATEVGGIPEIVVEGKTGLICKPQDIESLKDSLERCLNLTWNSAFIKQHARQFDWHENSLKLRSMIEKTLVG